MREYFKSILFSPVTHFNVMIIGFFLLVGLLHNHTHHSLEIDPDGFVRRWCKENPEVCVSYGSDTY